MPDHRRRVSLKDLAQELGVSIATVSRALRNSPEIGKDMQQKVKELAKRLAILRAGQIAAGESGYLIASPGFGGSRTITDYALRREKRGLIQVTLLKAP